MATKNQCLVFKSKQQNLVVNDNNLNGHFNDLNLNQNNQHQHCVKVQSQNVENRKISNYDCSHNSDSQTRQNSTSFGKTKLSSSFANLNTQKDYGKKEKPKETLNAKSSTLSLHIAAYENSIEATSADDRINDEKEETNKKVSSRKSWKSVKESINGSASVVDYAFELPRQQQDQKNDPEVMQFKASQRLSNVNGTGSSSNAEHANNMDQNMTADDRLSALRMAETKQISADELAVYDRQIRLWGLEAQNRLRNSSVLLYGMTPLGAEIGKNLMLCGLNALTVADGCLVDENDANFLIDVKKDAGKNRAVAAHDRLRVLNPLVKLDTVKKRHIELTPDYLKKYDLVILVDQGKNIIKSVDAICRENKIRFIAGGIYGWTGYAFFDFDGFEFLIPAPKEHAFVDEKKEDEKFAAVESPFKKVKLDDKASSNEKKIETVTLEEDNAKIKKSISYPSFADSLALEPEKLTKGLIRRLKPANFIIANACLHLENKLGHEISADDFRDFVQLHANNPLQKLATDALNNDFEIITDPPLPATCAIVGGVLSQEAIKSLSQNDTPHKNFFAYNAIESMGYIYDLPLIK